MPAPEASKYPVVQIANAAGTGLVDGDSGSAGVGDGSVAAGNSAGVKAAQSYVAVPAFVSGNTAGAGGTNATVVQVLAANPNRRLLSIENNGGSDVEIWFGAIPPDGSVGQTIKRGKLLYASGGGMFRDAKVETGAIYATASAATGLSVEEG